MEYRVQEYVDGKGYHYFRPQQRAWYFLWFWQNFKAEWDSGHKYQEFPNLAQAWNWIDKKVSSDEEWRQSIKRVQVKIHTNPTAKIYTRLK